MPRKPNPLEQARRNLVDAVVDETVALKKELAALKAANRAVVLKLRAISRGQGKDSQVYLTARSALALADRLEGC